MHDYSGIISRYEDELLNRVAPFWMERAADRENGGFFNSLDREGNCFDFVKSMAMQWRNVYMFAALYNSEYSNGVYLEFARFGFDFCWKTRTPDGYPASTDVTGRPLMQGKGFMETMTFVYAGCACAELFRATGEERFREEAQSCFTHYLGGLKESEHFSRSAFFPPVRRRGCYMHLCHLCRTMLACGCEFDGKVMTALEMTFEIIPKFYCAEAGRWLEHMATEGGFHLESALFRAVVPGHDFETMWFLAQGAELAGNREILARIPEWTLHIFDYATDRENGGLFYYMDALDKPLADGRDMIKGWWIHNEALLAAAFAYRLSGDERLFERFLEVDDWSWKHFRDPDYPEWFGLVNYDGSVRNGFKGSVNKTFFHLPRALYNCIQVFKSLQSPQDGPRPGSSGTALPGR